MDVNGIHVAHDRDQGFCEKVLNLRAPKEATGICYHSFISLLYKSDEMPFMVPYTV
jgi:hypothetical protein